MTLYVMYDPVKCIHSTHNIDKNDRKNNLSKCNLVSVNHNFQKYSSSIILLALNIAVIGIRFSYIFRLVSYANAGTILHITVPYS